MKKTLLAVALGALAVATTAQAGWYAEGDLGVNKTKFSGKNGMNKTKVEPRVSVGYDFGGLRVAGDYTHHGKFSGDNLDARIYGVGVSAFYDINTNLPVKPYVGVRLSDNIVRVKTSNTNGFTDETNTKFGYGAVAGVQYPLGNKVSVNGNVEYNRLGTYVGNKINNYGAKAGVRYDF